MIKKSAKDSKFKLEVHFNEEGLFIIGNKQGLSELAKAIDQVAQVEKSDYHHVHLNLLWDKLIEAGSLIINFDWIKKKAKIAKKKQFDITVMQSDAIGEELWNQQGKEKAS